MYTKVAYCFCVLFGGNANNGANAGFSYANSNNTPSNTNANIRSHLWYLFYKQYGPYLLVKNHELKRFSVGLYPKNSNRIAE